MDLFDEDIAKVLRDGKPRSFKQLLQKVDFSHNTLKHHLERLIDQGLMVKEKNRPEKPGRPLFFYSMPLKSRRRASWLISDPFGDIVTLPFQKLRQACRYEKGGYCKTIRGGCEAQNCPQILK